MPVRQAKTQDIFELLKAAAPARGSALQRMDLVAKLLDAAFVLPGTRRKIGLDAIIGLVPGAGDIITTLLSSYIIWEARRLGLPRAALGKMMANLAVHATVGSIPLLGDVFDAFFQVNQRNMRIVHAHLRRTSC